MLGLTITYLTLQIKLVFFLTSNCSRLYIKWMNLSFIALAGKFQLQIYTAMSNSLWESPSFTISNVSFRTILHEEGSSVGAYI